MVNWSGPPSSYYEPPDEPELPEPGKTDKCDECGGLDWGKVEQDGDDAVAQCETKTPCASCKGTGRDPDTTPEERVALLLAGEDNWCDDCDGEGSIKCEGTWSQSLVPDPPEPDDDDDWDRDESPDDWCKDDGDTG
jgi:hypothetical protein